MHACLCVVRSCVTRALPKASTERNAFRTIAHDSDLISLSFATIGRRTWCKIYSLNVCDKMSRTKIPKPVYHVKRNCQNTWSESKNLCVNAIRCRQTRRMCVRNTNYRPTTHKHVPFARNSNEIDCMLSMLYVQ